MNAQRVSSASRRDSDSRNARCTTLASTSRASATTTADASDSCRAPRPDSHSANVDAGILVTSESRRTLKLAATRRSRRFGAPTALAGSRSVISTPRAWASGYIKSARGACVPCSHFDTSAPPETPNFTARSCWVSRARIRAARKASGSMSPRTQRTIATQADRRDRPRACVRRSGCLHVPSNIASTSSGTTRRMRPHRYTGSTPSAIRRRNVRLLKPVRSAADANDSYTRRPAITRYPSPDPERAARSGNAAEAPRRVPAMHHELQTRVVRVPEVPCQKHVPVHTPPGNREGPCQMAGTPSGRSEAPTSGRAVTATRSTSELRLQLLSVLVR